MYLCVLFCYKNSVPTLMRISTSPFSTHPIMETKVEKSAVDRAKEIFAVNPKDQMKKPHDERLR